MRMHRCQLAAANHCDCPQNLSATVLSLLQVVNPYEGGQKSILRRHELITQLFGNLIQYRQQSLTQTHKQAMSQLVFKQMVDKKTTVALDNSLSFTGLSHGLWP